MHVQYPLSFERRVRDCWITMSVPPSFHPSFQPFALPTVCLPVHLSARLSLCPSDRPSVHLSACPDVRQSAPLLKFSPLWKVYKSSSYEMMAFFYAVPTFVQLHLTIPATVRPHTLFISLQHQWFGSFICEIDNPHLFNSVVTHTCPSVSTIVKHLSKIRNLPTENRKKNTNKFVIFIDWFCNEVLCEFKKKSV